MASETEQTYAAWKTARIALWTAERVCREAKAAEMRAQEAFDAATEKEYPALFQDSATEDGI